MTNSYMVEAWNNIEVECFCYYQPEEKADLEYPGCDEEFYIEEVKLNGEDITENLSESFVDALLDRIKDSLEPDYQAIAESKRDAINARYDNES